MLRPAVLEEITDRCRIAGPARHPQGVLVHRHPAVDGDHQEIEREPDRDQPEAGKAKVQTDEQQQDNIGGDQEADREVMLRVPVDPRHGHELQGEADQRQGPPSEPSLGERAQAPPQREPDQDASEDCDHDEEHAYRLRGGSEGRVGFRRRRNQGA
jgi:hypothetical protein